MDARLLCPSLSPRVCSNSCPLSQLCYPTISSSATLFCCPQSFPASESFPWSWFFMSGSQSKYWSFIFNISLSSEYSGLISFRIWLVWTLCCPMDSQESSLAPQFNSINFLALSLLYGPVLTSVHDYGKNFSFNYMDLCWQSDISAFLIH